jgi:hypothetical protein
MTSAYQETLIHASTTSTVLRRVKKKLALFVVELSRHVEKSNKKLNTVKIPFVRNVLPPP